MKLFCNFLYSFGSCLCFTMKLLCETIRWTEESKQWIDTWKNYTFFGFVTLQCATMLVCAGSYCSYSALGALHGNGKTIVLSKNKPFFLLLFQGAWRVFVRPCNKIYTKYVFSSYNFILKLLIAFSIVCRKRQSGSYLFCERNLKTPRCQ